MNLVIRKETAGGLRHYPIVNLPHLVFHLYVFHTLACLDNGNDLAPIQQNMYS